METADSIIADVRKRMDGALSSLKHSLNSLRTGRASASMLDPIKAEVYGGLMPLNQLGTISSPEPRLIVMQVWDREAVKAAEKAIANAGLGFNPITEGSTIRIPIPDLSEERRKEYAKKAAEYCESSKVALRNIRRDGMESIKKLEKSKEISEDLMKQFSDKIQNATDEFTKKSDEATQAKVKEIMSI